MTSSVHWTLIRISELEDIGTCGNKMKENYFQNPKHPRTMGQFQKV